jgi:hypothetical protein
VMNTPVLARCPANAHRMLEFLVFVRSASSTSHDLIARPT